MTLEAGKALSAGLPGVSWDGLVCQSPGAMVHPGLPWHWGLVVVAAVIAVTAWVVLGGRLARSRARFVNLVDLPLVGAGVRRLSGSVPALLLVKTLFVALFLLVIAAGLFGTPIPERNLATALTWNLWWVGLVVSVFFLGSAWCAVCPWDTLAGWLVRRRLWRRADPNNSLNLRVPRALRGVWPALWMFLGLTWLELGVGITTSPYATGLLSLTMLVLATVSLALFERRAFCRYFCPVGRTVGAYSQLAPLELRPIDGETCAQCKTLDCYHGTSEVEPCPTHLVMGRLTQNTYCTSCGNCTRSCPHANVAWRLRPPSLEAVAGARPHADEAWFMLVLLAVTAFHGLTMMPFWEVVVRDLARLIGDSGQLLASFTIALAVSLAIPIGLYALAVAATRALTGTALGYARVFQRMAFVALPLAFAYHLAHNLNHLMRETGSLGALLANPLGIGTLPMSATERHAQAMHLLVSEGTLFGLQAALMVFGFWIAARVVRRRGAELLPAVRSGVWRLSPMLLFAVLFTGVHLWMLMQPMVMRM